MNMPIQTTPSPRLSAIVDPIAWRRAFIASLALGITAAFAAAGPAVNFTQPENGAQLATFAGIGGTAQTDAGTIQQVTFSIHNQATGRWWSGTEFQDSEALLAATVLDGNWAPASGVALPVPCCGQPYQLSVSATDNLGHTATVSIVVHADSVPPAISFSSLSDGQMVSSLPALGGAAEDNFGLIASVTLSIEELNIFGGPGRWWNGTNFQSSSVAFAATFSGTAWWLDEAIARPALNSGAYYGLTATATDINGNSYSVMITVQSPIAALEWDPGETSSGTFLLQSPNDNGGFYLFKTTAQNTTVGAWRTALNVSAGDADVYLEQGWAPRPPNPGAPPRPGSDGLVLHSSQFQAGQDWYLLVHASANAQWTLLTGEAHVHDLGALAVDGSSSTNVVMGPEGMAFFKTTVDSSTLAWSLWLNGAENPLRVRKSSVPHPVSHQPGEPVPQAGQMLVVPDFLAGEVFNGFYFVSVSGAPGESIRLDSRKQSATEIAFASTNAAVHVTGAGYRIFRVQVPVEQIAWEIRAVPGAGNPNLAVRREKAPNEWNNEAFSEAGGSLIDSLTLVPPALSDGTFYITVYGAAPFSFTLQSANPVVTDVPYLGTDVNADVNRVGWRFYRVTDIASQLGTLGWDLLLQNAPEGTELALRRNAVPGRWNYRAGNRTEVASSGYLDFSSASGELQRPAHQADIWYLGVYNPGEALNAFTLIRRLLLPQTIALESNQARAALPAGHWDFYRVDLPESASGWDLRVVDVTEGDPRLVIRRDQLPVSLEPAGSWPWMCSGSCSPFPSIATHWASGNQWPATGDWTGYSREADGGDAHVSMMAAGIGNPLEPGTYYVGVHNDSPVSPASYRLQSRGIGAGFAVPVVDLNFLNGRVTNTLPAREAAYYRVVIPPNTPSWKVKLTATSGETLLLAQKDSLPNMQAGRLSAWSDGSALGGGGKRMQKVGNDHFVLMPLPGERHLAAGIYHLAVAGEGADPDEPAVWQPRIGSGSSSYVLESIGALPVIDLGTITTSFLSRTGAIEGGEIQAYQFTVPEGTASVEALLENLLGAPGMALVAGTALPNAAIQDQSGIYGTEGGETWSLQSDYRIVTVANPLPGTYSLLVRATAQAGGIPDASYILRLRAAPPAAMDFNGGTSAVSEQPARGWRFFRIEVPAGALGWDLRVTNVTEGNPLLVVRRDELPDSMQTTGSWPYLCPGSCYLVPSSATNWASGNQWPGTVDWTGHTYSADGADGHVSMIGVGMGNPLEPGTYYIGVYNGSDSSPASYTLQSRGIGSGLIIPVTDLSFVNGSVAHVLPAREAAYYRVIVPPGSPSWKVKLTAASGEAMLLAQKDFLPNMAAGRLSPWSDGSAYGSGGKRMQKEGDEHFVLMPLPGETTLAAGVYFLAVASEGNNPEGNRIGSGSSGYVLESTGPLPVADLGTISTAFVSRADLLAGGELRAYRFTVPAGTASIEVTLEDREGNPGMAIAGTALPNAAIHDSSGIYGTEGGETSLQSGYNTVTLGNPSPGSYTVLVRATADGNSYPDASYTLKVRALGPVALDFNAGSGTMTGQPAGTWQFFQIDVPEDALGWDVRLVNVTEGDPRLVVRRNQVPESLSVSGDWPLICTPSCHLEPWIATNWNSGAQLPGAGDWTGNYNAPDGSNAQVSMLAAGMGNPLEPGSYYVGVINANPLDTQPMTYTIVSRGIGSGYAIPVSDLPFSGGRSPHVLAAREAAYYHVVIPPGTPSWKVKLTAVSGDSMMVVQKDVLPHSAAGQFSWWSDGSALGLNGGKRVQKAGNEHYLSLPPDGETELRPGTYFLAVISEGVNPSSPRIGTGSSSYILETFGAAPVTSLGTISATYSSHAATLEGGELKLYQFSVPPGTLSVEALIENRVGNPSLAATPGDVAPRPLLDNYEAYGVDGGKTSGTLTGPNVITVSQPGSGLFTLAVRAGGGGNGEYLNAGYTLKVRQHPTPQLSFTSAQNTIGSTNALSSVLSDNQRAYFRVQVPESMDGMAVAGWTLDLITRQGNASVRVRKDLLPHDDPYSGTTAYSSPSAGIVPPFLTPGTWFVEVRGSGATDVTLISSVLAPERIWSMPEPDQPSTTPGLSALEFGDSGTDADGNPLLDPQTGTVTDRGLDLEQGRFHFYAIVVPAKNIGLIRTVLEGISGNPDLYLRAGAPPTLSHGSTADLWCSWCPQTLFDRSQTGNTTEYGNWVPMDGRSETQLAPGIWYLAVHAAGTSNSRYRLRVAQGDVQDLSLNGGGFSGQMLLGGDWRYYRVQIPEDAPANWHVTFSQESGDVAMHLRDTIPPGLGRPENGWETIRDWASDAKNSGDRPFYDPPGTHLLSLPPLRPGHIYYLGFRAINDATFSVGSTASGPSLIPPQATFYRGFLMDVLPPNGSALFRIDVPADAVRWRSFATHNASVRLSLEQGTVPRPGDHNAHYWTAEGMENAEWNIDLASPNHWPWVPDQSYFLLVTNTSPTPQPFEILIDGRNAQTDDENDDGLPDFWQTQFFGSYGNWEARPDADPDEDGLTNLREYEAGTNPLDGRTPGHFSGVERVAGGTIRLHFIGEPSRRYSLEASDDLVAWIEIRSATASDDRIVLETSAGPGQPSRFYRARLLAP
jgi:large repetitive protein